MLLPGIVELQLFSLPKTSSVIWSSFTRNFFSALYIFMSLNWLVHDLWNLASFFINSSVNSFLSTLWNCWWLIQLLKYFNAGSYFCVCSICIMAFTLHTNWTNQIIFCLTLAVLSNPIDSVLSFLFDISAIFDISVIQHNYLNYRCFFKIPIQTFKYLSVRRFCVRTKKKIF